METYNKQQEILLITGTSFAGRDWSRMGPSAGSENADEQERLEEACWNGLLPAMLPEILLKHAGGKELYLWNIKEGFSYLELELGELPFPKENYYSIDPYACLQGGYYS